MTHYADSSVLCSLYSSDSNSSRADLWRQSHPVALPFTPLHRLEVRNALWLAAFQKRHTVQDALGAWQSVEADIGIGGLQELSVAFADALRDGEILVDSHTLQTGARSLDILHIASARLLGAVEFVTFDHRQANLAGRLGFQLSVI